MTTAEIALRLALGLATFAVMAAAFGIGREALRRLRARAALQRLDAAARLVEGGFAEAAGELATKLRAGFDLLTIERVVHRLLADEARRSLGAALFREFGMGDRQAAILRDARAWAERTEAAQVLGRAGCAEAIPPLVRALRDAHEDPSVKAAAAEALAKLRDPRAVPFLVRELREVDESASRSVAEALVRFGALAVPELMVLLADEAHQSARVWAARILGEVKATNAVDALVSLMNARNDLLRIAAAGALGEIGDRRALRPLVQATLRDPAPQVRAQAAGAVGRIEAEGAADVLVAALADPDYVTRLRALEAFENIQLKDVSSLVGALRDPKNEVRRRAALALERVGYVERVVEEMTSPDLQTSRDAYFKLLELGRAGLTDGVVSYMSHSSFEVRAMVARAAGELGAASSARLLFVALEDAAWPVRAAAAEAIGRLRLEAGTAPLVARLADVDEAVREAAAEAVEVFPTSSLAPHAKEIAEAYARGTVPVRLRMVAVAARLGADGAADLLVRASTDPSETVRLQAVRAMGDQRPADRFLPQLVERITDASLEVRTAAVGGLGAAVTAEASEALLRSLPGAPAPLRDRIAEALARGGREHLFRHLDELAHVEDTDVRIGIAWTLGRIGEPAVLPYLEALLHANEASVRASAAGALAKVDAPGTASVLLEACEDRDPRTRAAVVNALGKRAAGDARAAARVRDRLRDPDPFVRDRAALVLAILSGAEAEIALTDPTFAPHVAPAARLVALSLAGSQHALERAFDLMKVPNALRDAATFLAHEDPRLRARFFARLRLSDTDSLPRGLEDPALVPQYDTVLRSSLDIESRRIAVEALARVPSALAVEVLADALRTDPAEEIRLCTARALGPRTTDDRARAALVRAVQDPSFEVAAVAARALAGSRDPRAQAGLFQRLGSTDPTLREAVESSLAKSHDDDVMALLDRVMGVDQPEILVAGLRVLERLADPRTVPLLELLLKSRHEDVRSSALRVLACMPREARIDAAIDATLDDPSERVRRAAVVAIAAAGDPRAVERLERVRLDPSPALRVDLARRLTTTPEGPSLAVLRALADDSVASVRAAALATLLERSEPVGTKLFLERWRRGLVDLRDEPRAETITAHLALVLSASADVEARKAAVGGIAAFRAPGFERLIVPALRDPAPEVRIDAVRALAGNNDPEVRARIAELLEDPIDVVREAARRSHLRMIG